MLVFCTYISIINIAHRFCYVFGAPVGSCFGFDNISMIFLMCWLLFRSTFSASISNSWLLLIPSTFSFTTPLSSNVYWRKKCSLMQVHVLDSKWFTFYIFFILENLWMQQMKPVEYVKEDKKDGKHNDAISFDGEQNFPLSLFLGQKTLIFWIHFPWCVVHGVYTHVPSHPCCYLGCDWWCKSHVHGL